MLSLASPKKPGPGGRVPAFKRHSKLLSWACKPPLGPAMALLQLLEGWAGSAISAGTLSSHPWKHGRAQSCKLNWAQQQKACTGSLGNRSGVTPSGRGDPHPTHELPCSPGIDGMKKNGSLVNPLSV